MKIFSAWKKAILAALLFAVLLPCVCIRPSFSAHAEELNGGFQIDSFTVLMTISSNRKIAVEEQIACRFFGYTHGMIRDFPLDWGVKYENIQAECDSADFHPYVQTDDAQFLSLYLRGDGVVANQTRLYTIRYTMTVPSLGKGELPLDLLGYGWQTRIDRFYASVSFPEGLLSTDLTSGTFSSEENQLCAEMTRAGQQILITAEGIGYQQGITLDLHFADGVLSTPFDFTILFAALAGVLLLGLVILLRSFCCKQPLMTVTVNLEAPERMDPLLMGKLIDNQIDSEDLGALVFYLADKGYLELDFSKDEGNPTILKRNEPNIDEPKYINAFLKGLFQNGNEVRLSDLNEKFYKTAESVKGGAELAAGKTYSSRGKTFIFSFGIAVFLLLGGFTFLYHLIRVFSGYRYWIGGISCLASYTIAAFTSAYARQREFKWGKKKRILMCASGFIVALLPLLILIVFKSPVLGIWTELILILCSAFTGLTAGGALTRTEAYSQRLGQILGFKQFILYTERDKIEFMLKENPNLYMKVLPYAQVLGVTDAWTEKFKGLDMTPPRYLHGDFGQLYDVLFLNHLFRNANAAMGRTFISRPSASGGGYHGGFGGGHGGAGGGFGGGGGRSC